MSNKNNLLSILFVLNMFVKRNNPVDLWICFRKILADIMRRQNLADCGIIIHFLLKNKILIRFV